MRAPLPALSSTLRSAGREIEMVLLAPLTLNAAAPAPFDASSTTPPALRRMPCGLTVMLPPAPGDTAKRPKSRLRIGRTVSAPGVDWARATLGLTAPASSTSASKTSTVSRRGFRPLRLERDRDKARRVPALRSRCRGARSAGMAGYPLQLYSTVAVTLPV